MSVELKFYDLEDKEISLSSGFDLGNIRKNIGSVIGFYVKNEGLDDAKSVILSSAPLNTPDEVDLAEIEKQKLASEWKTFSFDKLGTYTSLLSLNTIKSGCFAEGIKVYEEKFKSEDTSLFQMIWTYAQCNMADESLKVHKGGGSAAGAAAQRMSLNFKEDVRDFEISFKINHAYDRILSGSNVALGIFPVRINEKGLGYILSFQYRAKDGKLFFGVYKDGKGMVSNLSRVYGTRIYDTNGFISYSSDQTIGAKIWNDENGIPSFQFSLDGKLINLYKATDKSLVGTTVKDDELSYVKAGKTYYDVGLYTGDIALQMSDVRIITEESKQAVYMKTTIDNRAEDEVDYRSSIVISYTE